MNTRGRKGIWLRGTLQGKLQNRRPVSYWKQNPTGYPFQIRIKLESTSPESRFPITKEELASSFALGVAKQKLDRWSVIVFGEDQKGVTYSSSLFTAINDEFTARNVTPVRVEKPSHDDLKEMIYQMGVLQGKFPQREFTLDDGRRLDVVWRRTAKSVPNWAFEVQIGGNVVEALAKLKHAWDAYNSIPVLVTRGEQRPGTEEVLAGSFHEIKETTRVLTDSQLSKFYKIKLEFRELKNTLGVV